MSSNAERPIPALSDEALDQLFRTARSFSYWLEKPVSDDTLRRLYELMQYGPTSTNGSPARFLFLDTPEAKQRLIPALSPTNVEKVRTAPVTVIVGYDLCFYEQMPKLFPHAAGLSRRVCEVSRTRRGDRPAAIPVSREHI